MPPPEPQAQALIGAAAAMGCVIDAAAAARLLCYRGLLQRWNQVYNLTAVRDAEEMRVQHLLDSLSIVAPIEREAGDRTLRILDVGSGGGLPGAVLALARPAWAVVCVDAVEKKSSFVRQVALELGAGNLSAIHARIERASPVGADVIVSRAFSSLADFVALTREHLAPSGVWLAMKGRRPDDELATLPATITVFHVERLRVTELDAERHLIWMRPAQSAIRSPSGDPDTPSLVR